MNTHFYEEENTIFSRHKTQIISLFIAILITGVVVCGCGKKEEAVPPTPKEISQEQPERVKDVEVPSESTVEIDLEPTPSGDMVSYDVTTIGRADPFMPFEEVNAYNDARNSAIAEANAYNARIAQIKGLQGQVIREQDDISPYSFNLPVPPTGLASEDSAAAKITRTKVVGIMYNEASPSAIINVDDKDYLVRTGDKIIGQEYKVVKINPEWITVSLGSNVYSAAIGDQFSKGDADIKNSRNDIYNLEHRFGGRKG